MSLSLPTHPSLPLPPHPSPLSSPHLQLGQGLLLAVTHWLLAASLTWAADKPPSFTDSSFILFNQSHHSLHVQGAWPISPHNLVINNSFINNSQVYCNHGNEPAEVVIVPAVDKHTRGLFLSWCSYQGRGGVTSGCGPAHRLTTPRVRTPSHVRISIDKRLDVIL